MAISSVFQGISRAFTSSAQASKNRTLSIENGVQSESLKKLLEGSTESAAEVFFPKKSNQATDLIKQIAKELIFDPNAATFIFHKNADDLEIKFQGRKHRFYDLTRKVKWDLIELDQETLDQYQKRQMDHQFRYNNSTYMGAVRKPHLYERLHSAEKSAIQYYTGAGSYAINKLLRKNISDFEKEGSINCAELLCHTAVIASGLNKIPPTTSKMTFRYFTDNEDKINKNYTEAMKAHKKNKELGFSSSCAQRALRSFGSYTDDDGVKIYVNPEKLGKDVSGLSSNPHEDECLFLPNTKEIILRKIVVPKKTINDFYYFDSSNTHVYLVKLVSKRQGVV